MWELTKSFRFEAAHSIAGTAGAVGDEIHGHSFRAEIAIKGIPDPKTGMIIDLGLVTNALASVQDALDHKLLNQISGLGVPTLEHLARFIWEHLEDVGQLVRVTVYRDSLNEACSYFGPQRSS